MSPVCSHTESIVLTELPAAIAGCEDCLAIGGTWVHLRMCQTCGRIGDCDSSPHPHASAHARSTGHPIARSVEPGENWSWCYVDEVAFLATMSDRERS
jgi:Zn-finger in ubiquitin-hydrolases and other protein